MSRHFDGDSARDLRHSHPINDPRALCAVLGLGLEPADRIAQANGITVRCPHHGGVSCSVTLGRDNTVRVRCFGCDFRGDALTLIAEVHGLHRNFGEVIDLARELANRPAVIEPDRKYSPARRVISKTPERDYPPAAELADVWASAGHVSSDADARTMLACRALDVERIDDLQLARVLPRDDALPRWARYQGRSWDETGHRLLLPMVDAFGIVRSVRAWRVIESDTPKRLPPAGCRASGLVLACGGARAMLAGNVHGLPDRLRVVVTEGEPDFLTWATRSSDADADAPIVIGILSGALSDAIAARIPAGASVTIRTDHDDAGDRYASEVGRSLRDRCRILRSRGPLKGAA